MALVFQYGSNTSSKRLNSQDRLQDDAFPVGIGYTQDNFELEFAVFSKTNDCGAANIRPGSGRNIWGVLYKIPCYLITRGTSGVRKSLDAIEGEGCNYKRISIPIRYPDGAPVKGDIITYVAIEPQEGLLTSLPYATYIICGLREHNVPDEYINYVKERVIANNRDLMQDVISL